MSAVRLATAMDRGPIAAMLARAFANDPAMTWMLPEPRLRARRLPRLFKLLFDSDAHGGVRLMSAGGEAATLWRAPGAAETGLGAMLGEALPMLATFGLATPRALALQRAIDAHFPPQPFWYLHIAGCDPAAQGRGFGKALVRAGLDRMGAAGLPFYLETATEANLGFYQALGFRVTDEWLVGAGGPRFWSMLNG